ncbi:ATP-binding protein [Streptomyces cavernicola]|uniref:ATP-binding protein n=1 Tax=Streptomyces cavernicola TaxID=3043613 RepID=A0ABT6SL47_9ACTN|nr:ATP-binding protein [Streptomyces sp. B-S-A6]MDI3408910.1 ATP-binding protein [Streptomyces sp. B-S-A6]
MTRTKAVASDAADTGEAAVLAFETRFPPAEPQVRRMRQKAAENLRSWGLSTLVDDVSLVVSELVTNAVLHGGGHPVGFSVKYSAQDLRIEVTDGNPVPAQVRSAELTEENGRGLFLVAALADSFGVSPDGTMTWCAFSIAARTAC